MKKPLKYNIAGNLQDEIKLRQLAYSHADTIGDPDTKRAYLASIDDMFSFSQKKSMREKYIVPFFGLLGLIAIAIFAWFVPNPSRYQTGVFWVILSIFAAGCAAAIPGFLEVKYKGFIRATGAIGVFILMFFGVPKVMNASNDIENPHLKLYVVPTDSTNSQVIDVDFEQNSSKPIAEFATKQLSNYYGKTITTSDYTCYRKSDGKIYTNEMCRNINEHEVLLISNDLIIKFNDKRHAYISIIGKFE
ncbi:hypothetical protein [Chitinophaga agri]|uniref:Uncharacterized protein n=1 Tax=Chitinophaga agri TaxID=2703787 RepID=A0A6B9ZI72_9BACT|nr:hypothetical protein [Chitinophaga agri]QHS60845.1 hypothetical protein GWR21_14940 [Chitinophaga agri]